MKYLLAGAFCLLSFALGLHIGGKYFAATGVIASYEHNAHAVGDMVALYKQLYVTPDSEIDKRMLTLGLEKAIYVYVKRLEGMHDTWKPPLKRISGGAAKSFLEPLDPYWHAASFPSSRSDFQKVIDSIHDEEALWMTVKDRGYYSFLAGYGASNYPAEIPPGTPDSGGGPTRKTDPEGGAPSVAGAREAQPDGVAIPDAETGDGNGSDADPNQDAR